MANKLGGAFYEHPATSTLVMLNDCDYVGDADRFAQWALYNYQHQDQCLSTDYDRIATECYAAAINNSKTHSYAQMSLSSNGINQTIVFELFSNIAPKTCENFLALC